MQRIPKNQSNVALLLFTLIRDEHPNFLCTVGRAALDSHILNVDLEKFAQFVFHFNLILFHSHHYIISNSKWIYISGNDAYLS